MVNLTLSPSQTSPWTPHTAWWPAGSRWPRGLCKVTHCLRWLDIGTTYPGLLAALGQQGAGQAEIRQREPFSNLEEKSYKMGPRRE